MQKVKVLSTQNMETWSERLRQYIYCKASLYIISISRQFFPWQHFLRIWATRKLLKVNAKQYRYLLLHSTAIYENQSVEHHCRHLCKQIVLHLRRRKHNSSTEMCNAQKWIDCLQPVYSISVSRNIDSYRRL
jgi:hypothetical protein